MFYTSPLLYNFSLCYASILSAQLFESDILCPRNPIGIIRKNKFYIKIYALFVAQKSKLFGYNNVFLFFLIFYLDFLNFCLI